MTDKKYTQIIDKVIKTINEGVILMTEKEEYAYKKRIIKDLTLWLKEFPFMHIIP